VHGEGTGLSGVENRSHLMEETRQKHIIRKDKIMNEKGKTITESIDQGTQMGKMLGGWTGNQAEVDKAVNAKLSEKSLTCDAFDAYLTIQVLVLSVEL
jgi:hypothetical protein